MYAYISPIWGAAPSQPMVTIFGMFSVLTTIGQVVFVGRVPENGISDRKAKSCLTLCLALTHCT
jgi:hypothetical protein